jgi:putative tricarboxylic transport membrane protein
MVLGLAMVVLLSGESLTKALARDAGGPVDREHGHGPLQRDLALHLRPRGAAGGIDFIIVAIGVFALARCSATWSREAAGRAAGAQGLRNLLPTWDDMKRCRFAFVNGSLVGFLIGILPGAGSTIASFMSYGIEKARVEASGGIRPRRDRGRGRAGRRQQRGDRRRARAAPHARHPGSGTTAILLAALILWGFKPGPLFIQDSPALFWGWSPACTSATCCCCILNLPLVAVFAQLLKLPAYMMYPLILGVSIVGVYTLADSMFQLGLLAASACWYLMRKLDYPTAAWCWAWCWAIRWRRRCASRS